MSENTLATQDEGGASSASDVEAMLARHWGVRSRVLPLGSLQDSVYRVVDESDEPVGAVRVSTSTVNDAEVEGEARCLAHLARALPEFDLPVLKPGIDGTVLHRQEDSSIRLMRWVQGAPLAAWSRLSDQAAYELGTVAGRVTEALRDFEAASLHRYRDWDPRHAVSVTERYASRCPESLRGLVDIALPRTRAALSHPSADLLPSQVVHMDLTDLNVMGVFGSRGTFAATSIVDFEDMAWSWRLCELAVTAHAVIGRRPEDPVGALAQVLAGFLEHARLSEPEADLLWSVVVARALACAVVESVEALDQPDNDYANRLAALDVKALAAVLDVDETFARAFVRRECGLRSSLAGLEVPSRDDITPLVLDSGPAGYQAAVDLTDMERDQVVPNLMALGTVLEMREPRDVVAPCECQVIDVSDGSVTLRLLTTDGPGAYLRVEGLVTNAVAGTTLSGGEPLGRVASSDAVTSDLHVQLMGDLATPSAGKVRDADLWRQLCPDPRDFLPASAHGLPPATQAKDAMKRRTRHVAQIQRTYFHTPPHIVAGRGQWLYDSTGRRHLDMVNNVAVAGHSHPRITAAAAAQLALLSTNSRFLYDAIADYADKIVATLPPELDTVLLVNSGSEAVELALQLARAHTGRHDVIVMDGVYHGWTTELLELGTIEADRPNWRERVAPWVHVADAPDTYRGAHGDDLDAYVQSIATQCEAALANGGPAAFLNEPVLGNRGGVVPPAGYQEAAYGVVRRAGGLCIADEVQVGYGRTGASFWTFESQGAAPDILASAKAAGNGHPVGFVACRREIAESFAEASVFFSTAAGNPVSCRVGEAVLDIIREEGLQENARRVGKRISAGLADLKARHPLIGEIYGLGLYQGVDLIEGPAAQRTPLGAETVADICERLLDLGCIVQPTGLWGNVLKIKPPLCIEEQDADYFLCCLDQVFAEQEELRRLVASTNLSEQQSAAASLEV